MPIKKKKPSGTKKPLKEKKKSLRLADKLPKTKAPKKKAETPKETKPTAKKPVKQARPKKPSKAKGRMSRAELEELTKESLRKTLIGKREQIVAEAKIEIRNYIRGDNRQLVETALDDGDWSVIDLSEDINLRKLSAHRDMLIKIDEALRKLRENTYGICEDCGDEIAPERLRVLKFATYCRDCQEKRELLESIEKKVL